MTPAAALTFGLESGSTMAAAGFASVRPIQSANYQEAI